MTFGVVYQKTQTVFIEAVNAASHASSSLKQVAEKVTNGVAALFQTAYNAVWPKASDSSIELQQEADPWQMVFLPEQRRAKRPPSQE